MTGWRHPTGSGDSDFLIMGDLNSYDKEDPIDAILAGGYTDLIYHFLGEDAYSYVFDGQIGYLDHALANQELQPEVSGTTIWHINADEPDLIDYDTTFKGPNQDAIYAPDAYRSSDHDPVIVGLNVCDEIAPTLEVSVSPDMLWPANHKYVTVEATVTAADNFDSNPTVTLLSVTSNEPDDGLGDGDKANDIVIVDDYHVQLRAERSGNGEGRIYTITYQATDACGNSAQANAIVTVPHDQGNGQGQKDADVDGATSEQGQDEVGDDQTGAGQEDQDAAVEEETGDPVNDETGTQGDDPGTSPDEVKGNGKDKSN